MKYEIYLSCFFFTHACMQEYHLRGYVNVITMIRNFLPIVIRHEHVYQNDYNSA